MRKDDDIFKIETNNLPPSQGKLLISEPFLADKMFSRSVILLVRHSQKCTMGLILNKNLPLILNKLVSELEFAEKIPIFRGGPLATDTLFFIHTLENITGAIEISDGIYLNGDFKEIIEYIKAGNPVAGHIRFFLGYSGWEFEQLHSEISENTWVVGEEKDSRIMDARHTDRLWQQSVKKLGRKYALWAKFPVNPMMN